MKKLVWMLLLVSVMMACEKKTLSSETASQENITVDSLSLRNGFSLLETNCFSCHGAESKVAPSMAHIKQIYAKQSNSKKEFTEIIANFLKNPNDEANIKIPEALRQFGMMPKMNLTDAQIQDIANYLYANELERPDWFEKNYPEEKKKYASVAPALSPMEKGQQFAMQAKGVLGKNLLEAIQSKGVEEAIAFCSTKALSLTDSVAQALQVSIKRVSDKNRNPLNAANDAERAYIELLKKKMENGEKPTSQLVALGGKQVGYYPILVDNMCLKCHGNPSSDISAQTLAKIKSLYPKDKATGYKVGDLRGLWVVEMKSIE